VDEAVAHFQKAVDLRPDFPIAHNNLGSALLQQGRVDEAVTHFQKAVDLKPDYTDAYANLGAALSLKGRTRETITTWRKALDIAPDRADVQNSLAWLLATTPDASLRDGAKAVALAAQANQLSGGGNPETLRTLAAAYAEEGSYGLASVTARRASDLAVGQKNDALAATLQKEILLYEADKPVREGTTEGSKTEPQKQAPQRGDPTGRVTPP
jgi:tetratricopeptide (TPR) repeat protein